MEELAKIPPVTRTLLGATLGVTLSCMLEIVSVYKVIYVKQYVLQQKELWRPFTSFFYGGKGLPFLFDMIMLYQNSNSLEETQYNRRSSDYGWQLLLSSIAIFILNIPFGSFIHHRQLLLSLVYVSCALDPEAPTSFWGLITMRRKFFPYALVGLELLDGGGLMSIARSFTGILVGHAWFVFEHAPARREARVAAASGSTLGRRPQVAGSFGFLYNIWDQISEAPGWFRRYVVGSGENQEQTATRTDRRPFGAAQAPRGRTLNDSGPKPPATTSGHDWGRGSRLGS